MSLVEQHDSAESEWQRHCKEALSDEVLVRPKAMVFEGGGVLGLAYAEALAVAESRGALVNTTDWAGASAGSLCAAMMACGASAEYLQTTLESVNFSQLKDDQVGIVRDLWSLYWNGGVSKGVKLSQWIGKSLHQLTGDESITFGQHHRRTGRRLRVVASSMTERRCLIFDSKATPDAQIKEALLASCSYPVVFPLVEHRGHLLWDGGILNNFPIGCFDESREVSLEQPHGRWPNRHGTLGFKLLLPDEHTTADRAPLVVQKYAVNNVIDAVRGMIECWSDAALQMHVDKHIDWPRTMPIRIEQPLSAMQFDLTLEQKEMLKRSGRNSATDFFDKKNTLICRSNK